MYKKLLKESKIHSDKTNYKDTNWLDKISNKFALKVEDFINLGNVHFIILTSKR